MDPTAAARLLRSKDWKRDFGSKAALYVYIGHHESPGTTSAHFVLPATTKAETEGTFTNYEGRVQRFWPALDAPGMARPPWLVLGALAAELESETAEINRRVAAYNRRPTRAERTALESEQARLEVLIGGVPGGSASAEEDPHVVGRARATNRTGVLRAHDPGAQIGARRQQRLAPLPLTFDLPIFRSSKRC